MSDTLPHPRIVARRLIHLYGGVDAAREALDKRFREVAERWNQDAGLMGRILRAHLFVEHYLTAYLEANNPNLGNLENARLSFAQKVALAEQPNAGERYLFPGIRRLNQIRNRLAHTLKAEVTNEDREGFLSIPLFKAMREALSAPSTPSDDPVVVLEDFARHAGVTLEAASNPDRQLMLRAIWGEDGDLSDRAT